MRLAEVLKSWRFHNEVSLRTFAKILKISPATISRIESGKGLDATTLMIILNWLMETK